MLPNRINLGPGILNLSGCRLIPSPTDRPLWVFGSDKLTEVSAGPAYYIDDSLNLQTIPAGSPMLIDGKLFQMGSWKEYCIDPFNSGNWTILSLLSCVATGNTVGDFPEYEATENGAAWHRCKFYASVTSGNPAGKQYCTLLYKFGTSGNYVITCRNNTNSVSSTLSYNEGVYDKTDLAGEITVLSDTELPCGVRCLHFSISWLYPADSIEIAVGPGSSSYSTILLYGASVNDIGFIWPILNSTSGVTILSRAGTSYFNMSLGVKNYKLLEALSGKVSGENLVPNGDFSNGSTNWALGTGWSVSDGILTGVASGVSTYLSNKNLGPLTDGALYEICWETIENTLNGSGFGFVNTDAFHTASTFYNTVGYNCVRRVADSTTANKLSCVLSSTSTSGHIKIKNFSVKKVTKAAASKIIFNWQPHYASSDATASQTIFKTGSKIIAFDAMSGSITLNDGTTSTSIALTSWTAKDVIKFKMLWGNNHPDYPGVNKMQICASKDGGATWINSSVVDFYGSIMNAGDSKLYYGGETLPQAVSNVKAYPIKSGDWPT